MAHNLAPAGATRAERIRARYYWHRSSARYWAGYMLWWLGFSKLPLAHRAAEECARSAWSHALDVQGMEARYLRTH